MSTASEHPSTPSSSDSSGASLGGGTVRRDVPLQVRDIIVKTVLYANKIAEDVIKPFVSNVLQTCSSNPKVVVVVNTPALLAILLALAYFALSSLSLILSALATILNGIFFVILNELLTLPIQLVLLLLDTAALAGITTLILVGANAVSQYTIRWLPAEGADFRLLAPAVKNVGWRPLLDDAFQLLDSAIQRIRNASEGIATVYEALRALISAGHIAWAASQHDLDTEITSRNTLSSESSAEKRVEGVILSPFTEAPAELEEEASATRRIDPVDISNLSKENETSGAIKQRNPLSSQLDAVE